MRVVIAEDSVLLREGLARLLDEAGFDVVEAVADGEQLLRSVAEHRPDVVVADVRMPPTHTDEGLRAALVIRQQLAGDRRPRALPVRRGAVRDGAAGRRHQRRRLPAQGPGGRRGRVRRRAAPGRPRAAPRSTPRWSPSCCCAAGADPLDALTPREQEVLKLMAEGRSNGAIAAALVVSRRRRGEAREQHLHQAGPGPGRYRPPARASRAVLPRRQIAADARAASRHQSR